MYLLRRYTDISAREAVGALTGDADRDQQIPAWEIDVLLEGIDREQKERREEV